MKKTKVYLGGDIMTKGSNLAREQEYEEFVNRNLDVDVYSPVMNKSINDKSNMTEEENNHLAEKIVQADTDRLWESDIVVMCPEQSAVGSMTETGILYGWKYMADKLLEILDDKTLCASECIERLYSEIQRISNKKDYYHYFDIRTNHLNEKDWRRSFSINQFLYGAVLATSDKEDGFYEFEEILDEIEKSVGIAIKPHADIDGLRAEHGDIIDQVRTYDPGRERYVWYNVFADGYKAILDLTFSEVNN